MDNSDHVFANHDSKEPVENGQRKLKYSVSFSESGEQVLEMEPKSPAEIAAGQSSPQRRDSLPSHIKDRRGSLKTIEKHGTTVVTQPKRRLSAKFESLDYNPPENTTFLAEQEAVRPRSIQRAAVTRWFVNFLIGAYVALVAFLVAIAIQYISLGKFTAIFKLLENCHEVKCLIAPTAVWVGINVVLVGIGSYLVTYHAPHAAGSGIPQIKCYLNGIKIPGLMSMKTMVAKAGGIVLSVTGGLACGKEGPMIHSGAICASGMARGEFGIGKKKCKVKAFEPLRSDSERRDFVSAGAAAGVSAAFGAPVGGVLFALEEGASFLNQMLTWRMLFSSMTASLLLNIIMSAKKGHGEDMSNPGLVSLGQMEDIRYKTFEIPIFMVMAVIGGLSGALFNGLNYHVTLLRRRFVTRSWAKVLEAVFVAAISAIIAVAMIFGVPDCAPLHGHHGNGHGNVSHVTTHAPVLHAPTAAYGNHGNEHGSHGGGGGAGTGHEVPHGIAHPPTVNVSHGNDSHHGNGEGHGEDGGHHGFVIRGLCPEGQVNRMANILFGTPEHGLHTMLHSPLDAWSMYALGALAGVYFLLACWTYGLMVSSGLFIPSLLIGALWGRVIGMAVMKFIPAAGTNIGKYALVGAACQLGGTVRMTISLTVIVIECTGDITFGIPVMLSLIIAKWMGDFFNTGIYDLHIEILGIPLLGWEPPEMCYNVQAREVMNTPVDVVRSVEKVGALAKLVKEGKHNGYVVVEDYDPEKPNAGTYGRCTGFILKSQIESLLNEDYNLTDEEAESWIDLTMYMDQSPYTIRENVSLPKLFKLFRGLGLRHLVVCNDRNQVVGMVTRKDLAVLRGESHKGHVVIQRLDVTDA